MSFLDHERRAPGMGWLRLFLVWYVARGSVELYLRLIHRVRYQGRDRIPRTGPLIYVANHQSHYDPPLVGTLVKQRPCAFLARASLFHFKPFGWAITYMSSIPLDTSKRGADAMRAAVEELRAGRCVLIFPEGSRTLDGAQGRYKGGVLLLAKRTNATIVPVAVEGCYDAWPRGRALPRLRGRLALRAGEPIAAETLLAYESQDALDLLRDGIETMRLELRQELRAITGGRYPPPGLGDVRVPGSRERAAAAAHRDAAEPTCADTPEA